MDVTVVVMRRSGEVVHDEYRREPESFVPYLSYFFDTRSESGGPYLIASVSTYDRLEAIAAVNDLRLDALSSGEWPSD